MEHLEQAQESEGTSLLRIYQGSIQALPGAAQEAKEHRVLILL